MDKLRRSLDSSFESSRSYEHRPHLEHRLPNYFADSFALPTFLVVFTAFKGLCAMGLLCYLIVFMTLDRGGEKQHGMTLRVIFGAVQFPFFTSIGIGVCVIDMVFGAAMVFLGLGTANHRMLPMPIGISVCETFIVIAALIVQEVDGALSGSDSSRWFNFGGVYFEAFIDSVIFGICVAHAMLCIVAYYDAMRFGELVERTETAIANSSPGHMRRLEKMIVTSSVGVVSHF